MGVSVAWRGTGYVIPPNSICIALASTRSALYARVSTLNGQHPEMQLSELHEYASRRNWQIVGEYVDEGDSGAKESRRQLNRLMADAHRRKFDLIAVWKIDRFGRSWKLW
jgi:DNA invertase Pin-like site-specific DNA recombinase